MQRRPARQVHDRIPRAQAQLLAPSAVVAAAAAADREARLRSGRPARRTRTPLPPRPAGRRAPDIHEPAPPRRRRARAPFCRSRPRRQRQRLRAARRVRPGDRGGGQAPPPSRPDAGRRLTRLPLRWSGGRPQLAHRATSCRWPRGRARRPAGRSSSRSSSRPSAECCR